MNDDTSKHSNNNLLVDMYSNTAHNNANQKQTTGRNVYTIIDTKLQSSSDLEGLDWDSTNSHTGELIIAYNNKIRNKILCLRLFYALYVEPNQEDNGHLVCRLDKDQVVVTRTTKQYLYLKTWTTHLSMMKINTHKKPRKFWDNLYLYLYKTNSYDRLY